MMPRRMILDWTPSAVHPAGSPSAGAAISGWPSLAEPAASLPADHLLEIVRESAARACGNSWQNLVAPSIRSVEVNHLLVVVGYGYLRGYFSSPEVVRLLETDDLLRQERGELVLDPHDVRRFRREHRRSLTDCLTHALVTLWSESEDSGETAEGAAWEDSRLDFAFLEPFYLQAQELVNRAVFLDSAASDH